MNRSSLQRRCDRGLRLRSRRRDRDTVLHFFSLSLSSFHPFSFCHRVEENRARPLERHRLRFDAAGIDEYRSKGEEKGPTDRVASFDALIAIAPLEWKKLGDEEKEGEEDRSIDRPAPTVLFGPLNRCCSASGEIRRDAAKIAYQRSRGTAL